MRAARRILVVRLGAMGDIIHALPAVASLKHSLPEARLSWIVESRWALLLAGNPYVDEVIELDRGRLRGWMEAARRLREARFDLAVDFQGLLKSALVASAARADRVLGFEPSQLRERAAGLFYSGYALARAAHVVDRNLELAAMAGAHSLLRRFPLPEGAPEGELPQGPFVLASPLAGWEGKQWPLDHYKLLAQRLERELGLPLVINGPPRAQYDLGPHYHASSIAGLIHATRRAAAVVGVDSGPLHLAAALGKPGVAVYGPTDPARNGPYGGTITVLRSAEAATSYQRRGRVEDSMRRISVDAVFEALAPRLAGKPQTSLCSG